MSAITQGIVRVKNMWSKGKGDDKGDVVKRSELAAELQRRIEALGSVDALLSQ
jgi:hypothetical protein